MNTSRDEIEELISYYKEDKLIKYEMDGFMQQVQKYFLEWPGFFVNNDSVIHSVKSREIK